MSRLFALILFCIFSRYVNAQTFEVVYSFANVTTQSGTVSPGPNPVAAGLSLNSFTARGLPGNPGASGRFSFSGWPLGALNADDNYENYSGALSPFSFYEFEIEVENGKELELESMRFSMRRSGTGVRNFCVRSGADSFTENLPASTGNSTKLKVIPDNVFFWMYDAASTSSDDFGSSIDLSALTLKEGSVRFRFYAWNAEASGGSFSIDNVIIRGIVRDSAATTTGLSEVNAPGNCTVQAAGGEIYVGCECKSAELISVDGISRPLEISGRKISAGNVSAGLYFLKLTSAQGVILRRLFIQAE